MTNVMLDFISAFYTLKLMDRRANNIDLSIIMMSFFSAHLQDYYNGNKAS